MYDDIGTDIDASQETDINASQLLQDLMAQLGLDYEINVSDEVARYLVDFYLTTNSVAELSALLEALAELTSYGFSTEEIDSEAKRYLTLFGYRIESEEQQPVVLDNIGVAELVRADSGLDPTWVTYHGRLPDRLLGTQFLVRNLQTGAETTATLDGSTIVLADDIGLGKGDRFLILIPPNEFTDPVGVNDVFWKTVGPDTIGNLIRTLSGGDSSGHLVGALLGGLVIEPSIELLTVISSARDAIDPIDVHLSLIYGLYKTLGSNLGDLIGSGFLPIQLVPRLMPKEYLITVLTSIFSDDNNLVRYIKRDPVGAWEAIYRHFSPSPFDSSEERVTKSYQLSQLVAILLEEAQWIFQQNAEMFQKIQLSTVDPGRKLGIACVLPIMPKPRYVDGTDTQQYRENVGRWKKSMEEIFRTFFKSLGAGADIKFMPMFYDILNGLKAGQGIREILDGFKARGYVWPTLEEYIQSFKEVAQNE